MSAAVVPIDQVDTAELRDLLERAYGSTKRAFLEAHGAWWHRGNENRLALVVDGTVAGYCAVIPTTSLVADEAVPAVWWIDLYIAPEFRGRGLQTLMDEAVQEIADLKLGFPNELAAKIHRKHGWGVREDLRVVMLPLRPRQVMEGRGGGGMKGRALKGMATLLEPLAAVWRWRLKRHTPTTARRLNDPDPAYLASIFERYRSSRITTTWRDADFLRWRFLEAPYRDQLNVFVAGPERAPTQYLITRHVPGDDGIRTRVLDLFGNFADVNALQAVLRAATRDAVQQGAIQVTAMLSLPELLPAFRAEGFVASTQARFCWLASEPSRMLPFGETAHWTLADSDNDAPS
jgi:GNAT superfamily N-acetyltransferase